VTVDQIDVFGDGRVVIYRGDVLAGLALLPDESVHCVVTSPPYWGLRDYGTATWEGGDAKCDHKNLASVPMGTMDSHSPDQPARQAAAKPYRAVCGKCGARRIDAQLGLEQTPGEYVAKMVQVFREVRRVMRVDATLWLNMGDCYASDTKGSGGASTKQDSNAGSRYAPVRLTHGLKPKDLVGMPWRLAFALQADGWWLRSACPWLKRNAMPESANDRPTSAVEYVFLFTKDSRYFYDGEAVKCRAEYGRRDHSGAWISGRENRDGHRSGGGSVTGKHPETGRSRRNSDWFFESWQGVYDEGDGPLAFIVNPVAASDAVSYGNYRIASADCPVHDYRADLARVLECDARLPAGQIGHSLGTDGRPVPVQEGAVVAIPVNLNGLALDESVAIDRNRRRNKTASELERDVIFFGISASRTECIELALRSVAKYGHKSANNIVPGASSGGSHPGLSEQTACRIFCIVTFQPPLFTPGCLCHYTGKVEKRQDHYAAFPPGLVIPCIKAGTSEKGCCPKCKTPWRRVVERGKIQADPGYEHTMRTAPKLRDSLESNYRSANVLRDGYQPNAHRVQKTLGWRPDCSCGTDALKPDDLDLIETPVGQRVGPDPSIETGRAGMNRPRGSDEGTRPITRYEQRQYAKQLHASKHRKEMRQEAGSLAFDHYLRVDPSGARPVPEHLLDRWLERGWLIRVNVPETKPLDPIPCTVLDIFCGSGTTAAVALQLGRRAVGIELKPEYVALAVDRIKKAMAPATARSDRAGEAGLFEETQEERT
jgi:site-specific DNA-methyltransferase (cytosine-N4-specific)